MNKGKEFKWFVLVVLFVSVLFYAYNNSINKESFQTIDGKGSSNSELQTEVILYTPELGNYPQKTGECWTTSTALQGRPGSLRCAVGNGIIDPCFKVDDKVICNPDPFDKDDTFELIYNEELPEDNERYDGDNKRFSWIYQLEDGLDCFLIQGTAGSVSTGELFHYYCDNNKVIIGRVNKGSDLWIAEVGYLEENSGSELTKREFQAIITAWE